MSTPDEYLKTFNQIKIVSYALYIPTLALYIAVLIRMIV